MNASKKLDPVIFEPIDLDTGSRNLTALSSGVAYFDSADFIQLNDEVGIFPVW